MDDRIRAEMSFADDEVDSENRDEGPVKWVSLSGKIAEKVKMSISVEIDVFLPE